MIISYNWLKYYIKDIPAPDKIADVLTFHLCEIEEVKNLPNGDTIFDLKILPDRAHDLLSHFGFAREISGLLGLEMIDKKFNLNSNFEIKDFEVKTETKLCRRYMARIVKNVNIKKSPEWMVSFLESIGQRSINNIVDATNFVMFDLGQPIHAFDLSKLENNKIIISLAKDGDEMPLVGSEKLIAKLNNSDIVITDGKNNLAVAGVKGGLSSGVFDDTKDILIEVANFDPINVRKTANRLGIKTDASKRYENDIPISLCEKAMDEISSLIFEMCPDASFSNIIDVYNEKNELVKQVIFKTDYVSRVLGVFIENSEIENILKNYNYKFSFNDGVWTVDIPSARLDLNEDYDFVEEIGRIYGYEKIKPELPILKSEQKDCDLWNKICFTRNDLIKKGYSEVMTYTFCDRGEVEVLASASDKNFLRNNLTDGLVESLKLNTLNLPLLDVDEVKIFEIGTVFKKDKEEMRVAYGDKKGIKEMTLDEYISSSPDFHLESTNISLLGNFSAQPSRPAQGSPNGNPPTNTATDNLEDHIGPTLQVFKPWSIYPFMTRDIAVWVPEGTKPKILSDIYKELGTELLVKEPKLFDQFTKDGKTSYAYRLVFQSYQRTLVEDEVNTIMENITKKIISLGFAPR